MEFCGFYSLISKSIKEEFLWNIFAATFGLSNKNLFLKEWMYDHLTPSLYVNEIN